MPRVVQDQKSKYETDELFKKLSQDTEVKYSAYRDRPVDERKRRFVDELREGHSVITFTSTGTNLTLQFCPTGLSDERSPEFHPTRESVDFDREPNRVHLTARFIMNGVCVKWVGWIDLETLNGKAKLLFDEEQAKVEDDVLSRVMKETQERIRLFEESQRRWQDQQQSTHMQSPPPLTQAISNQ